MEPVILASARKHGIADEDMLHAYRNPIRVFDLDDLTLVIGASRAGEPLEIGVASAESIDFIVHAMSAPPVLEVSAMPRSLQDILDHADELARRFEDYQPDPEDEIDVAEYLLRRAALSRARSERQVAEAVVAARRAGVSWKRIGAELGISAQAAQQRYGSVTEPV